MAEIKYWNSHIPPIEEEAKRQLENLATMPFIHRHVAVMPDCHAGKGCTVGAVVPTVGAIIPACVGVDLGCGVSYRQTSLKASDLPDSLTELRSKIEEAVPHGNGRWQHVPSRVTSAWTMLYNGLFIREIEDLKGNVQPETQLGTLGGGNHFIELTLDENDNVGVLLHSGSRGIGNRIGTHYISQAREEMQRFFIHLPDKDLAYLVEGTEYFNAYVAAVEWAQEYARMNRHLMMSAVLGVLEENLTSFSLGDEAISCHHNYISRERHYGKDTWVTRKGAVYAGEGVLGIIPGSMKGDSFIVQGKGNRESFNSCSHGAGRVMSRAEAKRTITLEQHIEDTKGVECRKDISVIDESPKAYKKLSDVMASQADLCEIVHTLRSVLCVKG